MPAHANGKSYASEVAIRNAGCPVGFLPFL